MSQGADSQQHSNEPKSKWHDYWNAAAVATIVSAIISGGISSCTAYVNSSRENHAKMVELALGILRAPPNEDVIGARSWAIRVINAHAGTPFNRNEEKALLKNAIPYVPSLDFSNPKNSQNLPLIAP